MTGSSHPNPPDSELRELLLQARVIAVVGASSDPTRPSYGVFRRLSEAGYRAIPVNPHERSVLGERAYPRLGDVPEPIDIVDVFRRQEFLPEVATQAVAVRATCLWLQSGLRNDEAASIARVGGLTVVMDACLAVTISLLGVHARPGP